MTPALVMLGKLASLALVCAIGACLLWDSDDQPPPGAPLRKRPAPPRTRTPRAA
jgi:hypothetical protein